MCLRASDTVAIYLILRSCRLNGQHISHQIYRTISDTIFLAINNYNLVDNKIKYFSFEILNIFLHLYFMLVH